MHIATRADCLPEPVLDLLSEVNNRTHLVVELGLQTVHDETARRIGRGHDYAAFLRGYESLRERGIRVCVHIINGLPGATLFSFQEMLCCLPVLLKLVSV